MQTFSFKKAKDQFKDDAKKVINAMTYHSFPNRLDLLFAFEYNPFNSMSRKFNFCAGPAALPEAVLETARDEMLNWHGAGLSIMEMSHRSAESMLKPRFFR